MIFNCLEHPLTNRMYDYVRYNSSGFKNVCRYIAEVHAHIYANIFQIYYYTIQWTDKIFCNNISYKYTVHLPSRTWVSHSHVSSVHVHRKLNTLHCCYYRQQPEVIGSLASLMELWCDNNRLSYLPSFIGHLQALRYLDASSNRLSCIEVCYLLILYDYARLVISQISLHFSSCVRHY